MDLEKKALIREILPTKEDVLSLQKVNKQHYRKQVLHEPNERYSKEEFRKIMHAYNITTVDLYNFIKQNPKLYKNRDEDEREKKGYETITLNYLSKMYRKTDKHKPTKDISKVLFYLCNSPVYKTTATDGINARKCLKFYKIIAFLDKRNDISYLSDKYIFQILNDSSKEEILFAINQVGDDDKVSYSSFDYDDTTINILFHEEIKKISDTILKTFCKYYKTFFMLSEFNLKILELLISLEKSDNNKLITLEEDILKLKIKKREIIQNAIEYSVFLDVRFDKGQIEREECILYLFNELNIDQKYVFSEFSNIFSNISADIWRIFCTIALLDKSQEENEVSIAIKRVFKNFDLKI